MSKQCSCNAIPRLACVDLYSFVMKKKQLPEDGTPVPKHVGV